MHRRKHFVIFFYVITNSFMLINKQRLLCKRNVFFYCIYLLVRLLYLNFLRDQVIRRTSYAIFNKLNLSYSIRSYISKNEGNIAFQFQQKLHITAWRYNSWQCSAFAPDGLQRVPATYTNRRSASVSNPHFIHLIQTF